MDKRLEALTAALCAERSDITSLLNQHNDDLADLPVRLFRTPEHDQLVTTVSVLMSVCNHIDLAITDLNRLKDIEDGQ